MPQLCTFGAASGRGFGLTEETGPGLPDDQFNLTTLLLPGNGTNGAQNNTFLDSSTNNFTVTRNGNTTQGTFSPFSFGGGTEQANGYYSGYFDGNGDYLTAAQNAAFNLGTGAFTVEGFFYLTSFASTNRIIGLGDGASGGSPLTYTGWTLSFTSTVIRWYRYDGTETNYSANATINLNQWNHVAVSRDGSGNLAIFFNGVKVLSQAGVNTAYNNVNANPLYIGRMDDGNPATPKYVTGYVSNVRVVNGSAVYNPTSSTLVVPTSPLTNITNTSLLTCQSSQFIDNSTNAFTITTNGNSQPTVVNPFGMTDWSGYFDGTGDYLNLTQSAFAVGTGNFTLEAWVFLTSAPGTEAGVISSFNTATGQGFYLAVNSSRQPFFAIGNGGTVNPTVTGTAISLNTWVHLAAVRSSGTISLYVNGSSVGTPTSATASIDRTLLGIGLSYPNSPQLYITGCISNARITSNAVYTSNFTPPTAPLTAISGTSLLTCQSSTFIDNSPNAFAITVNGNAYTGTLNNPFGSIVNYTTPPLQAWSNYFDGTGDYLTFPELNIPASTSFTIEFWFYWSSAPSTYSMFMSDDSGNTSKYIAYNVAGATLDMQTGGSAPTVAFCSFTPIINTWYHLAFVRNTNTVTIYVNGVAQAMSQATQSGAFLDQGTINYIGRWAGTTPYAVNGYMSNFRAVVGTAVYTANFTVPTTPLTVIQNTRLLTCQSNRFVDNSINRLAITLNGDTSVQPFSPFNPDAAYSTTSVGGSGYFDGSGDYLTVPNNAAFDLASGNFTIECWAYPIAWNATAVGIFGKRASTATANQIGLEFAGSSGTIRFAYNSSGSEIGVNGAAGTLNAWQHIAVVRNGSTLTIYKDGVSTGTATISVSIATNAAALAIGVVSSDGSFPITGYITNLRIVKGTALYTSAFTPPTAPLTAIANTQLLANYTNAGIPDATAKQVLETVGNAQISTTQSKFGGSSMSFDGTGDYLKSRLNYPIVFLGAGNWTVEGWVYLNTTSGTQTFITGQSDYATPANASYALYVTGASAGDFFYGSSFVSLGAPNLSASTWTHCAWVRNGSNINFYRNGTNITGVAIGANSINNGTTNPLCIGGANNGANPLNGYLDDVRVTKGYARYTSNFTPPTSAFPLL